VAGLLRLRSRSLRRCSSGHALSAADGSLSRIVTIKSDLPPEGAFVGAGNETARVCDREHTKGLSSVVGFLGLYARQRRWRHLRP